MSNMSFRSMTFVSKSSDDDDDNDEDEEVYTDQIDFEDPEFIVQSIIKGLTKSEPEIVPKTPKPKAPSKTPPPTQTPVSKSPLLEETEHEKMLRLRAERFSKTPPPPSLPTLVKKIKPSPLPIFLNKFLFPSLPTATMQAVKSLWQKNQNLKEINAKTSPIELTVDSLDSLFNKTNQINFEESISKLKALFTTCNISYTMNDDSIFYFPDKISIENNSFDWLQVKSHFGFANGTSINLKSELGLGCLCFSLGLTETNRTDLFDLRWFSTEKKNRHLEMFSILESGSLLNKVDLPMKNSVNCLFFDQKEDFTFTQLNRIRRDLFLLSNSKANKQDIIKKSKGVDDFLNFFDKERVSPLFAAKNLLVGKTWRKQEIQNFEQLDWVIGTSLVDDDLKFQNKVASFLNKAKVKFTPFNKRVLVVDSLLDIEGKEIKWILPINSLVLLGEDLALIEQNVKQYGEKGALMFSMGYISDFKYPHDLLPIDFRLLAVA